MALAIFDLDHTLLSGDTDLLWCDFLVARGVLGADFQRRNAELGEAYRTGRVDAAAFSAFYAGTLAGGGPAHWDGLREAFVQAHIRPRLPDSARERVDAHRRAGDELLLSTATNRYLAEPSAAELGFAHLLATELDTDAEGRYTGRPTGVLNMQAGKVLRLDAWLNAQGRDPVAERAAATFYSDSANDLPLLEAVGRPVAVDPDARLAEVARARGWPVIRLTR
jgi:HAD superfamily hydrolase (TIGR01490 family)